VGSWGTALVRALRDGGPALLFGVRLWASVCLALYVAFWLELDNAYWAGTSAAIVCQPQLGASLRKGWFRLIGTLVGATMIVVLTGCFPQNRIAFLGLLALWCAICAFAATLLRNYASYSAALAGYTAAIIAADTLGATGGASTDVFMLAVWRASEICIGIVCAGLVLSLTDFGGARRQLAALFAALAAEITDQFIRLLVLAGPELPETQSRRRELVRRVIALDPTIDQAIGESSQVRYHSPILQRAFHGLSTALDAWRVVATHLRRLPHEMVRHASATILRSFPHRLRSATDRGALSQWMVAPLDLRRSCERAVEAFLHLPALTPSVRLLADETARLLTGILHVLDGLALLVDAPARPHPGHHGFRLSVPDWLPALSNAARAFITISAVQLFWVTTAWPSGGVTMTFTAIVVLLLSPKAELAYTGALAFTFAIAIGIVCTAIIEFAILPRLETFAAFCVAIGLYLVPVGFGMAQSRKPAMFAVFAGMALIFIPALAPTNQMNYDTEQFYNFVLAIFVGCAAAALSFRVFPPPSPALRTRRLLALTLRDLRRLAIDPRRRRSEHWEVRVYGRLAAIPDEAEPLQRAQLLTTLSVGREILRLHDVARTLALAPELDAAFAAIARGNSAIATSWLARLDHRLASRPDVDAEAPLSLRARTSILAVSEALAQHSAFIDDGASYEVH
jgi:uncharacterized membrane protein YccC